MPEKVMLYVRWKLTRSVAIYESQIIYHISERTGEILCGIDKRFKDLYEIGFDPFILNEANKLHCCKLCVKIAEKKYNW